MTAPDMPTRQKFLEVDLYNSLRWLFEGAIAWKASFDRPERTRHQSALGMFTSLVQARALYEFFYANGGSDDARVCDFVARWSPAKTDLYVDYMAHQKPANKRVFHLVYNRDTHAGGTEAGKDRLEDKVLLIAIDIRELCEQFLGNVLPDFHAGVQYALSKALSDAQIAAGEYGIAKPL
jgi:hypothetical protein